MTSIVNQYNIGSIPHEFIGKMLADLLGSVVEGRPGNNKVGFTVKSTHPPPTTRAFHSKNEKNSHQIKFWFGQIPSDERFQSSSLKYTCERVFSAKKRAAPGQIAVRYLRGYLHGVFIVVPTMCSLFLAVAPAKKQTYPPFRVAEDLQT